MKGSLMMIDSDSSTHKKGAIGNCGRADKPFCKKQGARDVSSSGGLQVLLHACVIIISLLDKKKGKFFPP